jgi:hypothetical protein
MLNTKKYLYIMPDSAYIAELLPSKKPHSFTIQVFRQINGEFLDDNEFIAENIDKLIKKIDPDEYHVILPDFLFTNTIVDVNETSEGEVKKYLKEELLPSLGLSKEAYELDTFILTQHKGKSKVQLSALEKSLLAPLQKACEEQKLKVINISPLSWTIKSIISLEPSLSTIQMGSMLYLSQHYIGIDQAISFKTEEAANIVETVKTLKGAEPNIQTMYLLTNALVENEMKENLSGTLPIQQLALSADEQEGMPAHIKQIIEASATTLDIPDYPVPRFNLGKYVPSEAVADAPILTQPIFEDAEPEKETSLPAEKVEETKVEVKKLDLNDGDSSIFAEEEEITVKTSALPTPNMPQAPAMTLTEEKVTAIIKQPEAPVIKAPAFEPSIPAMGRPMGMNFSPNLAATSTPTPPPQANMVPLGYMNNPPQVDAPHNPFKIDHSEQAAQAAKPKMIIKNKSDAGSLLKIVGITLAALLITVGLGVGIGFGLLSYTQKSGGTADQGVNASPTTSTIPTATVEPSPSLAPSPSPTTVAKDKVKMLIVNATKTPGAAGKLKTQLTTAGYKSIETGNAKGTYATPGTFVLMSSDDQSFISTLSKDAGVTLEYNAAKDTEDPKGAYDVIIVLNQ